MCWGRGDRETLVTFFWLRTSLPPAAEAPCGAGLPGHISWSFPPCLFFPTLYLAFTFVSVKLCFLFAATSHPMPCCRPGSLRKQ